MIRAALISILFLSVTLVLILIQPTTPPTAYVTPTPVAVVSRSETLLDSIEALEEEVPSADAPVDTAADFTTEDVSLSDLTQAHDSAEMPTTVPVQTVAEALPPEPSKITDDPDTALEALIVTALKQGQSDDYIDALVNDAVSKNTVDVPDSLITSDGRVDTASLLSVLQHTDEGSTAGGDSSYEVQPGDSLASIAYRFYGDTDHLTTIFEANQAVLSSPDHVEVGQILVIPAL